MVQRALRSDGEAPPEAEPALSDEDRRRRDDLTRLLAEHKGNISAVAREMNKARMQVQRWIKRFRLEPERFR